MNIGIDFDKVFVNHPPFVPDLLIDFLYKKKNHKLVYRFPGIWEQKIRTFSHNTMIRQPIKENIRVLSEFAKQNNYKTYLISGRFGFLKDKTQDWLKKYNINKFFKNLYFNFENDQPHKFKDKIIKKNNIQKYIDDDLDLLLYLAKENPKIDFYWLTKKIDDRTNIPKNITPIRNLLEFKNKYL